MTVRYVVVLSTLLPFMSCSEMPMAGPDATCNCPTPTAAQVSYSNTASRLTSTNVQGAVDELAGRAAEPPLAARLYRKQVDGQASTMQEFASTAACDDETHDIALGGDCVAATATANSVVLIATALDIGAPGRVASRYSCRFRQLTGATATPTVGVLCLRNAR